MSDEAQIRPFADFIRDQRQGRAHNELSEALHDLVAAVKDTGKKGSVTLRLSVEPMKGNTGAFTVTDQVKSTLPEPDKQSSLFWIDNTGNLARNNPEQPSFEFLRDVSAGTDPSNLKEAN